MQPSGLIKTIVIFSLGMLFLPSACGKKQPSAGDQAAKNRPPAIQSVQVTPQNQGGNNTLQVSVEARDPDGDEVSYSYQWMLNGNAITAETRADFTPPRLSPEDKITVRVTPSDGKEEGKAMDSEPITIPNQPPAVAAVKITPERATVKDNLAAQVEAGDPENDAIDLAYQWYENGKPMTGQTGQTLEASQLQKGKVYGVGAIPSDQWGKGKEVFSTGLIVANVSPRIVSSPPVSLEGGVYRYPVKAEDTDNDTLTFSLLEAPPGMTIDKSGMVEWTPGPELTGNITIGIRVDDPDGGTGVQRFTLTIQGPK